MLICFGSLFMFSQNNFSKFTKLSGPKKWWVVFHPFKAKVSLEISNETKEVTKAILKSNIIGKGKSGGRVDAFRHAFWMARLTQVIGRKAAKSLGKAHEKENYQYYLENKLEDGFIPDKASMDMDLFNNDIGLSLVKKGEEVSKKEIINRVIKAINKGDMLMIKKDRKGRFLSCEGKVITNKELQGKWLNNKCLISTNEGI